MKDQLPWQLGNSGEEQVIMEDRRSRLWPKFNINGNQYISYAEVEKGVRDVLKLH